MDRILIGPCSWTDKTLIECGRFYPQWVNTPADRLRFYASHFPTVEVDSSYYALPNPRNSGLWVERTPEGFLFHIKAYALFTQHGAEVRSLPREVRDALPEGLRDKNRLYLRDISAELQDSLWDLFREALLPLDSAGKLGLMLFQFPPWFFPSRESREYIVQCKERLPQYRLAIEFRHSSWLNEKNRDRTLAFLNEHGLTFVCVDEPQGFKSSMPPMAEATSDIAYVRFHGRNVDTWEKRGATASERFNYYYADQELQEWVPRLHTLQEKTREVYVLFNTNYQDQGPVNARKLAGLLGEGLPQAQAGTLF